MADAAAARRNCGNFGDIALLRPGGPGARYQRSVSVAAMAGRKTRARPKAAAMRRRARIGEKKNSLDPGRYSSPDIFGVPDSIPMRRPHFSGSWGPRPNDKTSHQAMPLQDFLCMDCIGY